MAVAAVEGDFTEEVVVCGWAAAVVPAVVAGCTWVEVADLRWEVARRR